MHIQPSTRWLALALAACGAISAHAAEPYPGKPVVLVVPTAPAGGSDTIARLFADYLGKRLGQPFVIENRPGANGILGVDAVARSAPDGYRLLFTYTATLAVNPSLYKKLPYDPEKDLAPIAQIGRGGNVLLVRKDLPVRTVQEFVDYAKARPDKLSYCSWGAGSGGHLTMEILKKQASFTMMHVPYKGSSPCVQDLMAGQVDAAFGDTSTTSEFVRAGRLKALAVSSPARLPALPEVPTLNEAGFPFHNYTWYGLLAPAKTPPAIVDKLNAAVNAALRDPAVVQRLHELNFTDLPLNTPAQFSATLSRDLRDWTAVVKAIGLQLD